MKRLIKLSGLLALSLAIMFTVAACGGGKDQKPAVKDQLKYFNDGLLTAQSWDNDKWGYIDNKGKEKIAFDYEKAGQFFNGSAIVKKETSKDANENPIYKCFLINTKGTALTSEYDGCQQISCGGNTVSTVKVVYAFYNNGTVGTNPEKIDFVDVKGKIIFTYELKNLSGAYSSQYYSYFYLSNVKNALITKNDKDESSADVKYGAVNINNGKEIFAPKYDIVSSIDVDTKNSSDELLLIGKKESATRAVYGFANLKGKVIVEPKNYTNISDFSYGIAVAQKAEKEFDFIDTAGKVLFSKTGEAYDFDEFDGKGLCAFEYTNGSTDTHGYIDRKGNVVLSTNDASTYIYHETDSDFIIKTAYNTEYKATYTVYDLKGKEIGVTVPAETADKDVEAYSYGGKYLVVEETSTASTNANYLSTVTIYDNKGKELVKKENVADVSYVSEFGFFSFEQLISGDKVYETTDTKGKVIIKDGIITDDSAAVYFNDADFIEFRVYENKSEYKTGFMTSKGKIVVPAKYKDAMPPIGNAKLYAVEKTSGKWGYADKDGTIKIEADYSYASFFNGGLAMVTKKITVKGNQENGYGFINEKGVAVVELKYQSLSGYFY